ncbi:YeeE/YedE family protein [Sanyastnella coralliicola]|uniref:YeeE/YedE family protein n=1 Tax=Sanyastnella coralliicola TaxID=3069118 RepID=UPI0027BA6195|nr:YeeE/YedE thiosulfate transporter family protein [Longitalea sp. SCSIO 12813]
MEFLYEPWPWYVAGPLITLTMIILLYSGRRFGVSSNFTTLCAMGGAGKLNDYFKIDWKANTWNIVFVIGTIIGGFIGNYYLMPDESVELAEHSVSALEGLGFNSPGATFEPAEIFGAEALSSWQGWFMLIVGGFFVGFGARYADGCTSGHAISGLSNLQLPSLITVIGFFIGGLTMVHLLFPLIFGS